MPMNAENIRRVSAYIGVLKKTDAGTRRRTRRKILYISACNCELLLAAFGTSRRNDPARGSKCKSSFAHGSQAIFARLLFGGNKINIAVKTKLPFSP